MNKVFIATCVLSCISTAIIEAAGEKELSAIREANHSILCREDLAILNDGTQLCGKLGAIPSIHYSFGTLTFDASDVAAIIFFRQAGKEAKIQYITRDGQSFIGPVPPEPFHFFAMGDALIKNDETSVHHSPQEIDINKISCIVLNEKNVKESQASKTTLNNIHVLQLKNGDQLSVILMNEGVTLSDGFNDYQLNPQEIKEVYFNGGVRGKVGEHKELNFVLVKDEYLNALIPHNGLYVKFPWHTIDCIKCLENTAIPKLKKEKSFLSTEVKKSKSS